MPITANRFVPHYTSLFFADYFSILIRMLLNDGVDSLFRSFCGFHVDIQICTTYKQRRLNCFLQLKYPDHFWQLKVVRGQINLGIENWPARINFRVTVAHSDTRNCEVSHLTLPPLPPPPPPPPTVRYSKMLITRTESYCRHSILIPRMNC